MLLFIFLCVTFMYQCACMTGLSRQDQNLVCAWITVEMIARVSVGGYFFFELDFGCVEKLIHQNSIPTDRLTLWNCLACLQPRVRSVTPQNWELPGCGWEAERWGSGKTDRRGSLWNVWDCHAALYSVCAVKTPSLYLQTPPPHPQGNLCSLCCRPTPFSFSPLPTATSPSLPCGCNLLSHASLLPDANLTTTCV